MCKITQIIGAKVKFPALDFVFTFDILQKSQVGKKKMTENAKKTCLSIDAKELRVKLAFRE